MRRSSAESRRRMRMALEAQERVRVELLDSREHGTESWIEVLDARLRASAAPG